MKYKEIKLFTTNDKLDELIDTLNIMGLNELVINDPRDLNLFNEENDGFDWNYVDKSVLRELEKGANVSFYMNENDTPNDELQDLFKKYDTKVTIIDDEDYLHKWEEYYVPTKIGERTVSKPIWKDYIKKNDEIVINIDPGQAFGTGSSPTTYLAVRLMEKYIKPNDTVIDVGSGTGILTVLASKLGAKEVHALDLDPKAVESTKRNVEINKVQNAYIYHADLLKSKDIQGDIIVANLTADILTILLNGIESHMIGKKELLFSGIIDFKEEEMKNKLLEQGFKILEILKDDCWVAMALKKE